MDKTYDHKTKELEILKLWESLSSKPEKPDSKRIPYTILMPPPNANAPLHCGHVTYAIQDLMIRFKRMQGFDTMYLSGTDHAGFETQVVYERKLKKEGKSRFDFDRETFYNDVLKFVKENSDLAINQLKRIGISANWEHSTFMLDEKVIETVYETFIKMHKDKMIYRDGYMVNYSTFYGTTFSDLETEYKDSVSSLYYVKYQIAEDASKSITVATVRPETIYADVAIAVNPNDARYSSLIGLHAINPLSGRELKIITDEYVDKEFATGALKITPGHDFNDYEIGKKNKLEVITVIDLDGKMNKFAPEVEGMFPKPARIKVAELLKEKGALEKVNEKYENRVLVDYKDGNPIEPLIIPNWFIKMDKLSEMAKKAIENEDVKFNLPMWKRDILKWITTKKPWPISRQTVFGIRIPVWYNVDENPNMHVTFGNTTGKISDLLKNHDLETIKKELQKIVAPADAKYKVSKKSLGTRFIQETDTFDTWFSSGQWPLTTTNYPDGELFKRYFPTDFLDSMWDIMFFWIARMIMLSLYLTGKVPFKNVYFHGAITDKFGKKMSKSLGNVINPMEQVEKYGADALRMGILVGGNTEAKFSPFDEDKVRGYRNFANKIWNIARYIKSREISDDKFIKDSLSNKDDSDLIKDLEILIKNVTKYLEKHKFKFAGDEIYEFIWERLANKYLESIKGREDNEASITLKYAFLTSLQLLHPYMPFVTESVWQELKEDAKDHPIYKSEWPV